MDTRKYLGSLPVALLVTLGALMLAYMAWPALHGVWPWSSPGSWGAGLPEWMLTLLAVCSVLALLTAASIIWVVRRAGGLRGSFQSILMIAFIFIGVMAATAIHVFQDDSIVINQVGSAVIFLLLAAALFAVRKVEGEVSRDA